MAQDGDTILLVKSAPLAATPRLGLGAGRGNLPLSVSPLFTSIGRDGAAALGLAGGGAAQWHMVRAPMADAAVSAWDMCHAMLGSGDGLGLDGGPRPHFAEPDLEQRWLPGEEIRQALALAGGCPAKGEPQDARFEQGDGPLWHRDSAHAQFDAAMEALGGAHRPVRIAHLDTGYDPGHAFRPAHLNTLLQRNFVDPERPNDASDVTSGLLTQLGHGTGTIGILAGRGIGAAPLAEVVPVRVADRVVLFRNSAIARAFDYVHALSADPATFVDVVTLSMGGVASQAWAEAVNALYERGVVVVAAAGNNFGNLPTRHVVYPARFGRVLAACGVMARGSPYADLGVDPKTGRFLMAGNYGPSSKMATALAAYTPNMPWPRFGCSAILDHDGAGTSSATPQVAAAAALWIARHRDALAQYPEAWMRAEAVRRALLASAAPGDAKRLGAGSLRALDALGRAPEPAAVLRRQAEDGALFPILRILTGLGLSDTTPGSAPGDTRQRMLELEALQLSQSGVVEAVLGDRSVDEPLTAAQTRRIAEVLIEDPRSSRALRQALIGDVERGVRGGLPEPAAADTPARRMQLAHAMEPKVPQPQMRRLRVYAFDPSLGARLDTIDLNEAVIEVPWEKLEPGPVGRSIEVVDIDPASRACYAPVDLDDPALLSTDGLRPTEADPRFHQQMTYAVAMKTIHHFERALGRVALWAPRSLRGEGGEYRQQFVPRLRIHPHALRTENAFYSPDKKALLFGYFAQRDEHAEKAANVPGSLVFSCLSHDIVAHETTHALLDGLHPRFREGTNPDVLAFHEAFADIVALFQHFTMPEALRDQIARTRGDIRQQNLLGELAQQFGEASSGHGALRSYLGTATEKDGVRVWTPIQPKRTAYEELRRKDEPHALGALLVSAVFDAFLQIYRRRVADLVRLATNGTGVLPAGDISRDLVDRMAGEASKTARHFLEMCIRALDYCPPLDMTFGDYLRALITADRDLVPDDRFGYRVALLSAFRDRGIYPASVRHLSPQSVVWEPPPAPISARQVRKILDRMDLSWDLRADREEVHRIAARNAREFWYWLHDPDGLSEEEIGTLGLFRPPRRDLREWDHAIPDVPDGSGGTRSVPGRLRRIEVHSVRPARRVGPDGQLQTDLVVELTQAWVPTAQPETRFRGGCTMLIHIGLSKVRYLIRKRVGHPERIWAQFDRTARLGLSDQQNYRGERRGAAREPFALLHAHH